MGYVQEAVTTKDQVNNELYKLKMNERIDGAQKGRMERRPKNKNNSNRHIAEDMSRRRGYIKGE